MNYEQLLLDPAWQEKRQEILQRDFQRCRNCGDKEHLHIHHRQYHFSTKENKKVTPWKYDNKYLVTLCADCHETGHKQYTVQTFKL